MNWTEHGIVFGCEAESMVGVLSVPASPASIGLLIIVGGPQYRAGSHRQFVHLARSLASAGIAAFRFDYRGMGDSEGVQRSFTEVAADVGAAIDTMLRRLPDLKAVVLWGLCDGASAALLYLDATADSRVAGLCLVNPWVRSDVGLARSNVKHYYRRRLLQGDLWKRLLTGRVRSAEIRGAAGDVAAYARSMFRRISNEAAGSPDFRQRMARALRRFQGKVLMVTSENDLTAAEFLDHARSESDWRAAMSSGSCQHACIAGADHTFSNAEAEGRLQGVVLDWLNRLAPSCGESCSSGTVLAREEGRIHA